MQLEEVATYYAQYLKTAHVKKPVFNKNFFSGNAAVSFILCNNSISCPPDFRAMMKGTPLYKKITDFDKCDFTPINTFLEERKEKKKNRSKEDKQAEKEEKQKITQKYGFALVDGHKQKVGNFRYVLH